MAGWLPFLHAVRMLTTRTPTAAIAAVTLVSGPCVIDAQAEASAITCANDVSGAGWQIVIDYRRSTVDSYPAQISDTTISWHDDKDGGNYTLDRKTGKLTVVVASSTGGYFLHHHCGMTQSGSDG